jgi:hypothetical protein
MNPARVLIPAVMAVLCLSCVSIAQAQHSAHDYYEELRKAGGLDQMADQYACFDEDPALETFFLVSKSETLKQFLVMEGAFKKFPLREQALLNKGFIYVKQYDKGVPLGEGKTRM